MAFQDVALPVDIPWKLLAASPDMMDTNFGNKKYPFTWRSSLAISAYEPALSDLPGELCDEHLTYLKITASITGYQPSRDVTVEARDQFPDVPMEDLDRILGEYFACYGVLLNVAVFPHGSFKKRRERRDIDFGELEQATQTLSNPYENGPFTFQATGQTNNRTVDRYPQLGDQRGELDLFKEMVVTFPAAPRVEAKVAHSAHPANPVTMQAFRGDELVGSQTAGREAWRVYELTIEEEAIDRVVLRASEGKASLLEFALFEEVEDPPTLNDYPHIDDFEPKSRQLYQAATEQGELLTASSSKINMGKSLTHTENTQTGLSLSAGVEKGPVKASAGLTHSWGETDQDTSSVNTDSSRERRETHSATTSLSQMYNLLSGYHAGTNRVTFLMLPRPHTVEPTDRRTFVQGLRMIEGVQEFLLIVSRPRSMEGLSVEVLLETGHMSEHPETEHHPEEYEEYEDELRVLQRGTVCFPFIPTGQVCDEKADFEHIRTPLGGYIVDRRKGAPEHRGLTLVRDNTHPQTRDPAFHSINYDIADDHARVHGWVKGRAPFGTMLPAIPGYLDKVFTVHYRSEAPKPGTGGWIIKNPLLITERGLTASFTSGDECIKRSSESQAQSLQALAEDQLPESIVDELDVKIDATAFASDDSSGTQESAMKDVLRQVQFAMSTSGGLLRRRPYGEKGFLESDYFKKLIAPHLREEPLREEPPNIG